MNVLIVDDSAAIRKILQRVLGQANVPITQVFEANDGLEALDVLRSNKVGLILSDINMPNMDGLQLLSQVRSVEDWKSVPMVMITTEGSGLASVEETRAWQEEIPRSHLLVLPGDSYHVAASDAGACAQATLEFIQRQALRS